MPANLNTVTGGAWALTQSLVVNNAATKTLTHNRGQKCMKVDIVDSTNKAPVALTFTVAQASVNAVAITNGTGGNLTVDVILWFYLPSTEARADVPTASWV